MAEEFDADLRRSYIMDLVNKKGKVKVSELKNLLNISEVTIRSDLSQLETEGKLERIHGGAVATTGTYFTMDFNERMNRNTAEKKRIALMAVKQIQEGDALMINSGTTTLLFAKELKIFRSLKIVTNSLQIAQELSGYADFQVVLLGGKLNTKYSFSYGDDATEQIKRYHANKLILSVDGICGENGLSTYHYEETDIDRAMIKRAKKTIVLADFSKIGRETFSSIGDIHCVDSLITNAQADKKELDLIKEQGVSLIFC